MLKESLSAVVKSIPLWVEWYISTTNEYTDSVAGFSIESDHVNTGFLIDTRQPE
jgi:hypothetical protein